MLVRSLSLLRRHRDRVVRRGIGMVCERGRERDANTVDLPPFQLSTRLFRLVFADDRVRVSLFYTTERTDSAELHGLPYC